MINHDGRMPRLSMHGPMMKDVAPGQAHNRAADEAVHAGAERDHPARLRNARPIAQTAAVLAHPARLRGKGETRLVVVPVQGRVVLPAGEAVLPRCAARLLGLTDRIGPVPLLSLRAGRNEPNGALPQGPMRGAGLRGLPEAVPPGVARIVPMRAIDRPTALETGAAALHVQGLRPGMIAAAVACAKVRPGRGQAHGAGLPCGLAPTSADTVAGHRPCAVPGAARVLKGEVVGDVRTGVEASDRRGLGADGALYLRVTEAGAPELTVVAAEGAITASEAAGIVAGVDRHLRGGEVGAVALAIKVRAGRDRAVVASAQVGQVVVAHAGPASGPPDGTIEAMFVGRGASHPLEVGTETSTPSCGVGFP